MPRISMKKFFDAPKPSRASRKNRNKQLEYDEYVRAVRDGEPGDVADLELDDGEVVRAVKVSLRKAAARVGVTLDIWDAEGHVYFRKGTGFGAHKAPNRTKTAAEVMRATLPITFDEPEEIDVNPRP